MHGSYHFARPALPVASSANAQAKFFAQTIGPVTTKATLPPALDLEVTGGLTPGQLVTWAQDFLLDLRSLTGRTPMIYTYPAFWDNDLGDPTALARYPMWMAQFGASTAPVADLWQYTASARVHQRHRGATDVSKFVGTSGFPWATLSNGTVATPWTASAPAAPVAVHASAVGGRGDGVVDAWRCRDEPGDRLSRHDLSRWRRHDRRRPTTYSATIGGLNYETAYTFTVTAVNGVGAGVASAPTLPVTPAIPTTLDASVKSSLQFGAALPVKATLLRADTHKGRSRAAGPGLPA